MQYVDNPHAWAWRIAKRQRYRYSPHQQELVTDHRQDKWRDELRRKVVERLAVNLGEETRLLNVDIPDSELVAFVSGSTDALLALFKRVDLCSRQCIWQGSPCTWWAAGWLPDLVALLWGKLYGSQLLRVNLHSDQSCDSCHRSLQTPASLRCRAYGS